MIPHSIEQKLKILLIHNFYQQPGGEDEVFAAERELLEREGHAVCIYTRGNDEISRYGLAQKLTLPLRTFWAWDSVGEIRELIRRERPDVAHFHNTFPLISPAVYKVCREEGVAVVQSLHNPRLMCPAATFHREGRVCQDCLGKNFAWPGITHACYRNSRVETTVVAGMLALHSRRGTWQRMVNRYIVASRFYRRIFARAGLPAAKLELKPHFVATDPGVSRGPREYALFVGRLAPEKGILTLLKAWARLGAIPLKIRGDGALLAEVRALAATANIEIVPRLAREELARLFQGARFIVWPSEGHYETFGLVVAEAFACGTPVIASRIGVMAEMVRDGETGLHFTAGNPADLAAKVEWAWRNPAGMAEMGMTARGEYEAKYTPERNYRLLMEIYERAMGQPQHREAWRRSHSPGKESTVSPGVAQHRG